MKRKDKITFWTLISFSIACLIFGISKCCYDAMHKRDGEFAVGLMLDEHNSVVKVMRNPKDECWLEPFDHTGVHSVVYGAFAVHDDEFWDCIVKMKLEE